MILSLKKYIEIIEGPQQNVHLLHIAKSTSFEQYNLEIWWFKCIYTVSLTFIFEGPRNIVYIIFAKYEENLHLQCSRWLNMWVQMYKCGYKTKAYMLRSR